MPSPSCHGRAAGACSPQARVLKGQCDRQTRGVGSWSDRIAGAHRSENDLGRLGGGGVVSEEVEQPGDVMRPGLGADRLAIAGAGQGRGGSRSQGAGQGHPGGDL